jgi:hypothetical protein
MQIKLRGQEKRDAEAFAVQVLSEKGIRNSKHLRAIAVDRLLVLGRLSRRWALRECNVACRNNAERDRRDKQREELRAEIEYVAEALGVGVELDGDPRGYTIKLKLPSKRYNSWDGVSWGVPTS